MNPSTPTPRRFAPVFKSLNYPLTILGIDRRLFFLAAGVGAGTFNYFNSLLGGVLMSALLFAIAKLVTASDPQLPVIVMRASSHRPLYDPQKREAASRRQGSEPA